VVKYLAKKEEKEPVIHWTPPIIDPEGYRYGLQLLNELIDEVILRENEELAQKLAI
jgi:hypothetical protein